MGNLIFSLAVLLLLQYSSGQKCRVSRDNDDKNLKSVEMLMETNENNPQSNKSHISRLVIKSSYGDSVSISIAIDKEINVTVNQDERGTVICQNQSEVEKPKIIMELSKVPPKKEDESNEKVFKQFETNYQRDDQRLENLTSVLKKNLSESVIDEKMIKNLDQVAADLTSLASKTRNLKLQDLALRAIEEYKTTRERLRNNLNIKSIIKRIRKSIRFDYFNSSAVEVLNNYSNELNQLQQTLTDRKQQEAVKQVEQEINEIKEAINLLETGKQVLEMEEEQFGRAVCGLSDGIKSILKSRVLNIKYKIIARYLYHKLQKRQNISKDNKAEAILKSVEQVLQMSPKEFENVVDSLSALKATLAEIVTSDLGKAYRDKAKQLLEDLSRKWSSHEEEEAKKISRKNEINEKEAREHLERAKKIFQLPREEFLKQTTVVSDLVKSLTSSELDERFSKHLRLIAHLLALRLRNERSRVLKLFARTKEILHFETEEFDKVFEESADIAKELNLISNSDFPKLQTEKAKSLLAELERKSLKKLKAVGVKEKLGILNAINQTLTNPNGFGGKVGLRLMRSKLKNILKAVPDPDVEAEATKLLKQVESQETKIDDILKLLHSIERQTHRIERESEVSDFEKILMTIKAVMNEVNDPTVSRKTSDLITRIQKEIGDYKVKMQINGITTVINKMNNSLEQVEIEDRAEKDARHEDVREKFEDDTTVPRKAPAIFAKASKGKELFKIIDGYLKVNLPILKNQIRNITLDYKKLKKNVTQSSGLNDRLAIAIRDYIRIKSDLKKLQRELTKFNPSSESFKPSSDITNVNVTRDKLMKLESLIDDDYTHDLLKQTLKLVQDVEHANDILKQLRKMILFNEKHLMLSSKSTDKPLNHVIVPIQRPSMKSSHSSIETAKAADKAVDLDKTVAKTGSK